MADSAPKPDPISPFIRALVRLMDDAITIPGTTFRIGWDAILGLLLPAAGDALTAISQVALLFAAVRARAPWHLIARMVLNVGVDALVGSVPLLGDLFDASFKANRKNLVLLERLEHTGATHAARNRARDYALLALAISGVLAVIATPLVLAAWLIGRMF